MLKIALTGHGLLYCYPISTNNERHVLNACLDKDYRSPDMLNVGSLNSFRIWCKGNNKHLQYVLNMCALENWFSSNRIDNHKNGGHYRGIFLPCLNMGVPPSLWKVQVFLKKGCIILWYNSWPHFLRYSWVNTDKYSNTSTTRYGKYWIMLVAIQYEYRIMNKYTWTYTVSYQKIFKNFHFSKNICLLWASKM